jgi:filamentous hemagglutinin
MKKMRVLVISICQYDIKLLNNPKPNTTYPVDGDKVYITGHLARPKQVDATLSPNVKDRNGY